jgi:hypothetical protein
MYVHLVDGQTIEREKERDLAFSFPGISPFVLTCDVHSSLLFVEKRKKGIKKENKYLLFENTLTHRSIGKDRPLRIPNETGGNQILNASSLDFFSLTHVSFNTIFRNH